MTPRLYAHRGAAVELPENTLPSFALALELGADALEMDVHMTRDGHVVVSHDPDGRRMADQPEEISSSDLSNIKTWDVSAGFEGTVSGTFEIPTLDEVLEEFPDTIINVDVKPASSALVEAVLTCISRHGAAERVQLASFQRRNLLEIRRRGYAGETALAPAEVAVAMVAPGFAFKRIPLLGSAAQIPTRAEFLRQGEHNGGVLGIRSALRELPWAKGLRELPRRLYPSDRWMLRRMRGHGLRVDFWTVNDADQALALSELGVDGIMTDDPRTVARALGKQPVTPER